MPPESATLGLVGDVMLGRLVNDALAEGAPDLPWAPEVVALFHACDAVVGNLECCIASESCAPWEPFTKTFHFRLDPAYADTLLVPGFSGVTLANNHTLDHGVDGLLETLQTLDRLGIPHAGAGRTVEEAWAPLYVDAGPYRVGIVNCADHLKEWDARRGEPGIAWIDVPPRVGDWPLVEEALARARADADLVAFTIHWGPNMRRVPPPDFQAFARRVLDAGADLYAGTSAHLFQGIEWHQGRKPILYDLGDFVDDYAVDPLERNDLSFFFRLTLTGAGVERVDLDPVAISRYRVHPALPEEAAWALALMADLCADLGTPFEPEQGAMRGQTRNPRGLAPEP